MPASLQIKKHFGIFSTTQCGTHTCLARTCVLYDVLSDFVIDSIIAPVSIGEITLFTNMLNKLQASNTIILLDRGFGYFSNCKDIINKKLDFCIRLSISQSDFSKAVLLNSLNDFITEWTPSDAEKKTCKNYGLDTNPIQVRVTKIVLKTGEIELLVSSIFDIKAVSEKDIQALYDLRWGIEEGFKKLKPKMKLEQFGCKRYEGIYQEFYAHIFMMNLVSIIGNDAEEKVIQKTKHRKLKYKYNWQNAFRFIREKFIDIFNCGEFSSSLEKIINQITGSLVAIKKGRHFARDMYGKTRRNAGCWQCYK